MKTYLENLVEEIGVDEALIRINEYKMRLDEDIKWLTEFKKPEFEGAKKWFKADVLDKIQINQKRSTPKDIYWYIGEYNMLEQDFRSGHLYYSYDKIFEVFRTKYRLNVHQQVELISNMVREQFNWSGLMPFGTICTGSTWRVKI